MSRANTETHAGCRIVPVPRSRATVHHADSLDIMIWAGLSMAATSAPNALTDTSVPTHGETIGRFMIDTHHR